MALFVVATPIGHALDLTERARQTLAEADLVIGEELKVLRQTMKSLKLTPPQLDQLNEHSDARDIAHFVEEAKSKKVALISDCGTPGFCDPGAELVAACVSANVPVTPVPGVSSLMTLLSVSGLLFEQFLFFGFLSPKREVRTHQLQELKAEKRPFVLLETPYRADQLRGEIAATFPQHTVVAGLNLTTPQERIDRGLGRSLAQQPSWENCEPIVLLQPPVIGGKSLSKR